MINKQVQELLKQFPDTIEVKLFKGFKQEGRKLKSIIHDFNEENLIDTSDTDNYDEEKDEVIKGTGPRYLFINPPIQ